jgi:hypothetical protein
MTPAAVLGFLALTFVLPAPQQGAPPNMPVAGSYRTEAERWVTPSPNFRASVHLDMAGKKVRISWEYSHAGVFHFNDGVPSDEVLDQEIAVGYWPTAADAVSADKLVVAGKDRTGSTRMELWSIDAPTVKTGQVPGRQTPYQLIAKSIRDITPLYAGTVSGKDTVRGLIGMRGAQTKAIVHFQDSRDLYTLDWGHAPYDLVLLSSKNQHPELATQFDMYRGGDHQNLGYIYLLGNITDQTVGPLYLFRDSNRDGTIDSESPVARTGDPLELGKRDRYIEYGGLPWPP